MSTVIKVLTDCTFVPNSTDWSYAAAIAFNTCVLNKRFRRLFFCTTLNKTWFSALFHKLIKNAWHLDFKLLLDETFNRFPWHTLSATFAFLSLFSFAFAFFSFVNLAWRLFVVKLCFEVDWLSVYLRDLRLLFNSRRNCLSHGFLHWVVGSSKLGSNNTLLIVYKFDLEFNFIVWR